VDLDRYVLQNQQSWNLLTFLTEKAHKKPKSLTMNEYSELLALYKKTATQLSFVQSHFKDPVLVTELTSKVSFANSVIYHRKIKLVDLISDFFNIHFPAAVWHLRYYILISALIFFIPFLVGGYWLGNNPDLIESYFGMSESQQKIFVEERFEAYYSEGSATGFFTLVAFNNIFVALLALATGILLGLGTVYILFSNGLNVGVALSAFIKADDQYTFWKLILPHGLLELTAIVVAGGAGLALGWAILSPGEYSRAEAFSRQALRSVTIVLGLSVCFVIAAIIEAFVTPSSLPDYVRISVGLLAVLSFIGYWAFMGSRAANQKFTGVFSDKTDNRSFEAV